MRTAAIAAGLAAAVAAVLGTMAAATGARAESGPWHWRLPAWVPAPVVPADNPMSEAKVELGRHLFFDRRLSRDESMSCAACHEPQRAFTDGRALPVGVTGERATKNAMSLVNLAYLPTLTWANPQIERLEVQALIPIFGEHPVEMGMAGREALLFERLRAEPRYGPLFARAFPEEAKRGAEALYSLATLTRALAAFQRALVSFDSPYDRYRWGGRADAIPPAAKRGEALFFGERLECYHCHGGITFTDNIVHARMAEAERGFHNTGLYNADGKGTYPADGIGLAEFTGSPDDMGRFRTPTLRNVAVTAPYMHDGSIATLREVIRQHYAVKGRAATGRHGPNPLRSPLVAGFEISDAEVDDVVAFLESLTDRTFLSDPRWRDPWAAPATGAGRPGGAPAQGR